MTQPLDRIDLGVAVGEVIQLYRLAEEGCDGAAHLPSRARSAPPAPTR